MKCAQRQSWRWFSELDAMSWVVSAYIASLKAMDPSLGPDRSDFAERFVGELQARVLLAGYRRGVRIAQESSWNLPLLASFADPSFSASELNGLPPADETGNDRPHGALRHG